MQARDLIHLAERIYVVTMPERGQASGWYRINDEETFVEQIAQHPSFKAMRVLGRATSKAARASGSLLRTLRGLTRSNPWTQSADMAPAGFEGLRGGMERIAPA
jgi:hypothetical protein